MVEKSPLTSDGDQPSQYRTQNEDQVPGGFDFTGSTSGVVSQHEQQRSDGPDGDREDASLQDAAMAIPDMDALSVSSLHTTSTDRAADEEANANLDEEPIISPTSEAEQAALDDTKHDMDWNHLLGLSGQGLNAANAATSMGFAAARQTTAFSLSVAKRFTQGLLALPAMALDGTIMGNAPNTQNYRADGGPNSSSIAGITHAAVGGIFDVISTLAVGGIDIGTAITGAGLGAAASGVEGVRRALGSEVLRSLGAFSRLVRREWYSASDTLPPGGIPGYSILGITQAMTAWVSIQMVTREYYEKKMLRNLEVVDLEQIHASIKAAKEKKEQEEAELLNRARIEPAHQETEVATSSSIKEEKQKEEPPKKKKKKVRILEDEELPGDEGDVIDAEIGSAADAAISAAVEEEKPIKSETVTDAPSDSTEPLSPPTGLNNEEAVFGLKRYSRLVLGVYGGVALAWLGSLPPDLMQAAGTVVDGEAATVRQPNSTLPNPNTSSNESSADEPLISGRPRGRSAAQDDAAEFLRAAASLDLEDEELIDDEAGSVLQAETTSTPASASLTPRQSISIPPTGEVLFSTDDDNDSVLVDTARSPAQATTSVNHTQATPSFAGAGASGEQQAPGRSYSYYDILMGTADGDIFHRLGGLEKGLAKEGDYNETSSQAGSAAQRLRRLNNRVARPSKPRYYVVTDHTQRKIVLVLRGSLTLGDIAIDLTCESANFDEQWSDVPTNTSGQDEDTASVADSDSEAPAAAEDFSPEAIRERAEQRKSDAEERRSKPQAREHERGEFIVHEGMYETAKEIGEIGRPVHRAVRRAMLAHPGYALDITGHSLGAGVAALLAIMWASPDTGMTTKSSGLPIGRKTHAYCFAVPCVMGVKLGKRAEPLVTSFCYSYDLVCRLSLGAILDIRNACAWLAYENSQPSLNSPASNSNESTSGLAHPIRLTNIMQRAFVHQSGRISGQSKGDLEADFLALRKTLEANMNHVELYPPGVVLYSLSPQDITDEIEPEQAKAQLRDRLNSGRLVDGISPNSSYAAAQKAVLYRLRSDGHREEVFDQIIHSRGMLSKHMPHVYSLAIDSL